MNRLLEFLYIATLSIGISAACGAQSADKPPAAGKQKEPGMTEIGHPPSRETRKAINDAWAVSWDLTYQADHCYAEGKFAEAVRLCHDAQQFAPLATNGSQMVNVFAQYKLGRAYLHLGEDEKALQMLLPLNSTMNEGEGYLAEAIAYARLGNAKMAGEMYQRFQGSREEIKMFADGCWSNPSKDADQRQFLTRAWHAYGNLELSGKPKLALLDYQKAKALDPNNPLIDFDLGFVLSRLERFEEASHYFQSAVKAGKGAFLPIAQKELALSLSDFRQQKARREAEAKKQQSGQ
jgi:tetratricopeptide (TPR) repeat protein